MAFTIVAKKFTAEEFKQYCAGISAQSWVSKIVLHNTSSPTLAQRPGGVLTAQHIQNLKDYYVGQGWSGGPHLFVDATGIWVFTPLTSKGVHSPSYNSSAWGVEMLGEYETESFTSGLGAQVAANAKAALAGLASIQGWSSVTGKLILHKEDPKTTHKSCPGRNVSKSVMIDAVNAILSGNAPSDPGTPGEFAVIYNGKTIPGAFVKENTSYAPIRALAEALGFTVAYDSAKNQITISKP